MAEALNAAPTMPEHLSVPTSAALATAAENALSVFRHCSTRADALDGGDPDPARQTAARAFRAGRVHAARIHRHLAHALDCAAALEAGPGQAAGPREEALVHQVLNSAALAHNTVVAGWREIAEIREELPPLASQTPPVPPTRRTRPMSAVPAGQSALLPAAGRRR
ncbi:hypothetical protein ACFVUH_08400 [Kitasatospora sp. NPDC058032]|uniref:hypothetical protein n=1 Tax=Kitasatospora sp. NPDC058032 TaxID=3346307 RepID=UPI0036DB964C